MTVDEEEGSGQETGVLHKSSIGGIPKVFPKLPKAPISSPKGLFSSRDPLVATIGDMPAMPAIVAQPEVCEIISFQISKAFNNQQVLI